MLPKVEVYFSCILLGCILNVCAERFDVEQHPNWPKHLESVCGISYDSDRIIGGTNATLGQYPWQARLGFQYTLNWEGIKMEILEFTCGGTLINERYVVTAAHCVEENPDIVLDQIHLGELETTTDPDCDEDDCADPVQKFRPIRILHPKSYSKPAPFKHDVALIKLDRDVTITDWVRPICLPYGRLMHKNFVGDYAEISGWGMIDSNSRNVTTILQSVTVPILPISKCQSIFSRFELDNQQICAGGVLKRDSCGGDSGGPMQKVENSAYGPRYFLIGIVSFGHTECGLESHPAIYTRVTAYLEWILDHIGM